jgi:hypothetical protein
MAMNENAIDALAKAIWLRVIGWEDASLSPGHACTPASHSDDPDDCPLFREIHDEITMWATARTKEGM